MFGVTFAVVVLLEVVVVQSVTERDFSSATEEAQVLMKNHSVESTPLASKGNQEIPIVIHKLGEVEIPLCFAQGIAFKEEYLIMLCVFGNYDRERNESLLLRSVRILERNYPFDLLMLVVIEDIRRSVDMIYYEILNILYATDLRSECMWTITFDDRELARYIEVGSGVFRISLSSDGGILVLGRVNGTIYRLEIYGLDGNFVNSFLLPDFIMKVSEIIQTPDGRFIISHNAYENGQGFITQLTRDGEIIDQFKPLDESQILRYVVGMTLDPAHDLLFVSEAFKSRVILLDSTSLAWRQEFRLKEFYPREIYYDVKRSQLFVQDVFRKFHIFSISHNT